MTNAEFDRPVPQALDNDALEIALAEAKQSSDGLLAAMVLLEQQDQLRRADEEALEAWRTAKQQANQTGSETAESSQTAHETHDQTPGEADPFVETASNSEEFDSSGDEFPYEPISASEVTVTTALNQIVADVNEAFSPLAAAEDVTALEEQEQTEPSESSQEDVVDSVSALPEQSVSKSAKVSMPFDWKSLALPLLVGGTFAGYGASFTSVGLGLAVGAAFSWLFTLIGIKSEQRSGNSHQVMSRATFGVWGAALPTAGQLAVRILLLCGIVAWAVMQQMSSVGITDAVFNGPLTVNLASAAAAVITVALAALGLLKRTSRITQAVFSSTALALSLLAGVLNFSALQAVTPDFATTATITITYLVFDALILGPSRRTDMGSPFRAMVQASGLRQLLPSLAASIAIATVLGMAAQGQNGSTGGVGNAIYAFIVDLGFLPLLLASLSIGLELIHRIADDMASLRVSKIWASVFVLVIASVGVLLFSSQIPQVIAGFTVLLAAMSVGANVPYLTEALMRRGSFHDVSLQRGYAFYKRAGIASLFGYVLISALGFLLTPYGWLGSGAAGYTVTPLFGAATGVVYLLAISAIWTLATSWVRIRYQQSEVLGLERRRNEIAGFDVFE